MTFKSEAQTCEDAVQTLRWWRVRLQVSMLVGICICSICGLDMIHPQWAY